MNNMENPFDYQRIVVGESFVDRDKELKTLTDAMLSGENMLLYSPRRLGKSSLLKEVLNRIEKKRISIYVDLWECLTELEIAEKLANSIINATYNKIEKAAVVLKEWISSARPFLTLEKDGSIQIKLEVIEHDKTLRETLTMIQKVAEKRNKRIVVVLDESQVITEFEGHRIEKIIRSTIQEQNMVTYIFSGSKQHILKAMINQRTRPFYRQLRPMTLGPISIGAFTPFIKKGFSEVSSIDEHTIEEIYQFASGNPQRTQQICHFLFSKAKDGEKPSPDLVKEVVVEICLILDKEFDDELDGIKNKRQRRILKALALDPTKQPMSQDFIQGYSLGPSSSVQTALKGLIEKGILDEEYNFVDPLFNTWFLFKYHKII